MALKKAYISEVDIKHLDDTLRNSAASENLKNAWAGTIEEVLSKLPESAFGRSAALNVERAVCGNHSPDGWVMIPITSATGFLRAPKDTGIAYIKGGDALHIELRDKTDACHAAAFVPFPTREEVKRQLIEYGPLSQSLKIG